MANTLETLLRLREAARKETLAALRKAEAEREAQVGRLADVRMSIVLARGALDPTDATDLTHYHGFRLRQEMAERREGARLAQKDRELEARRNAHILRVRDELSLADLIEARERVAINEANRAEQADLDEIAGRGNRYDAA